MDRYVVGEWLARIQFVSAGTFMGGVVDLLDDGLQVGVRQAVETGPLGQVAADPCMCSIGS